MSIYSDGGLGPTNKSGVDTTKANPRKVVYVSGSANEDESWRLVVSAVGNKLSIEHYEPLTETDIILDDAKISSVQGNSIYSPSNIYIASVLVDSRVDNNVLASLSGNMVGRFIVWDGSVWLNFVDQWVEKTCLHENIINSILTSSNGSVLVNQFGNVLESG